VRAGAEPAEGGDRAVLDIDLGALADNYRLLRNAAGGADCAAVVKADGYGLGLERVAATLRGAGARTFFVAHLEEGRRLRAAVPDAQVYVLNGMAPGRARDFAADGLRPVLGSPPEIEEWSAFSRTGAAAPAPALHVDTGMNRLGLSPEEARSVAAALPFRPSLVLSHMACADRPEHPLNARQLAAFRELAPLFSGVPASLANSAATLLGPAYGFDLVRPGIALYGAGALEGRPPPGRPVATLSAPVIQLREVPTGATVGYGATFRAARPSRIAVLSLGYADGYIRAAGGAPGAPAAVAGIRVPVVGRVSMDLTAVDVTDLREGAVRRGTLVEIFGPSIPVDEVARAAGTIGYEILTRLGPRLERRYSP